MRTRRKHALSLILTPVTNTLNRADAATLAERLAALTNVPVARPKCTVTVIVEKATAESPEVGAMLKAAFNDASVNAVGLAGLAGELGYDVTSGTIQRHRRRGSGAGCRCPG